MLIDCKPITVTRLLAAVFSGGVAVSSAWADLLHYQANWVGLGNAASATAVITIDIDLMLNPGSHMMSGGPGPGPGQPVNAVSLTVSGAANPAHNGVFTHADFFGFVLVTTFPLSLSANWFGQPQAVGTWGTNVNETHDFNLFGIGNSPSGTWFYELTAGGGFGETMRMTDFAIIPAPAPALLLFVGGLAVARRHRQT